LQNHFLFSDFNLTIDAIYPSPAQNETHILTDFDKTAQTDVQVFDLTGRLRYSKTQAFGAGKSALTIPIHFSSGIYVLRIGEKTKKFVVIN